MSYADDYEEDSWREPPEDLYALAFESSPYSLRQFHIPVEDLPVITVERGGIYSPSVTPNTHQKEHTMTRTKAVIVAELNSTNQTISTLVDLRKRLQRELSALGPAEPSQPRASVNVWFTPGGKRYEFLLIRTPRGEWYTTGTSEDVKKFRDWDAVAEWLVSPDVFKYADLIPLVKQDLEQVPF